MNYMVKRIIVGVCIALVMMVVHKLARADESCQTGYHADHYAISSYTGATAQAACAAYAASPPPWTSPYVSTSPAAASFVCNGTRSDGSLGSGTGSVICVAGAPAPTCTAGAMSTFTKAYGDANGSTAGSHTPTNDGACSVNIKGMSIVKCYTEPNSANPKQGYCVYTAVQDGTVAPAGSSPAVAGPAPAGTSPSTVQVPADPSVGCPAGTLNIGTDSAGTSICAGSGTNPGTSASSTNETKSPTTTVTNPDGSSTATSSSTTNNADGSSTTATTNCTTSTSGSKACTTSSATGNNSAGQPGKSDAPGVNPDGTKKPDDPKTLCDKNPQLNVCQNSQVTGNGCSGGVSTVAVTGDAIQGAILKKMADEACANSQVTAEYTLGNSLMAGHDPLSSSLPTKANATGITLNSLDSSGFLGGGASCLNDVNFSVMGQTHALPFSTVCPYLLPLRYAMMVVAGLVSLAIMRKAILGG